MAFSYIVSLQVRHPDADPQNIIAAIGLPPTRFWKVGEQRTAPNGTELSGTYDESYCSFHLGDGADGELAGFLRGSLQALAHAATFIAELRGTGGRVNFFVSWSVGDRGEVFDVELLTEMARIGIDLGIAPSTSQ